MKPLSVFVAFNTRTAKKVGGWFAPSLMMIGILGIGCGGLAQSFGQDAAARISSLDTRPPAAHEELESRAKLSLGHPDLGEINLVQRHQKPDLFTFTTNQSLSYTDNAFLQPNQEQGSGFWNGRIALTLVPYATRRFTPSVMIEQNFFRYDRFPQLDFDAQTVTVAAKFDLTRTGHWFTTTSYALTRLYTSRFDTGDFYKFGVLTESVSYVNQLGRTPIYTGTTLGGTWRSGNPSTFDRFGVFLNHAAFYAPSETVQIAAFIRPEVHLYTNHDSETDHHGALIFGRPPESPTDFNLSAGVSLTWTPTKAISVGANVLWTRNWSTYGPHQYNVFTPSVTLTASIAF